MREFLSQILRYIRSFRFEARNIIEILILAVLIYYVMIWVKRTKAWVLLRGVIVLLAFVVLANILELNVITYIAERTLSIMVIALLVLFQPELRAALEQIGQGKLVRSLRFLRSTRAKEGGIYTAEVIEAVVDATYVMAQNRTGALIVLERQIDLSQYIKTGIRLDAVVSSALLINIFEHNTPLHDGAVIMKGEQVAAATCYLPLSANPRINKDLGTRHRAAIGMSEETDSWTVVVSEETGHVSLARRGVLTQDLKPDELREALLGIETDFGNAALLPREEGAVPELPEEPHRGKSRRKGGVKAEGGDAHV